MDIDKRASLRAAWRYSHLPPRLMLALLLADVAALATVTVDPDSPIVLPYLLPTLALVTAGLVISGAVRAVRAHRYGCW